MQPDRRCRIATGHGWVDRILRNYWADLELLVPAQWMPDVDALALGAGRYGCVLKTRDPEVLCKITSDPTEANFVAASIARPALVSAEDNGITRYKKILGTGFVRRRRPVYVLWRTAADHVGFLDWFYESVDGDVPLRLKDLGFDQYHATPLRDSIKMLDNFMAFASLARDSLFRRLRRSEFPEAVLSDAWNSYTNHSSADSEITLQQLSFSYRGIARVGAALRRCWDIGLEMSNTDVIYPVGKALVELLEEGVLLADVHAANVGLTSEGQAIITDPGHALAIHPIWQQWPDIQHIQDAK